MARRKGSKSWGVIGITFNSVSVMFLIVQFVICVLCVLETTSDKYPERKKYFLFKATH